LGNLLREDGQERTHNHTRTDAETAARQNPRETELNRRSHGGAFGTCIISP